MPSPIRDSEYSSEPMPEAYLTPEQRLSAVSEILTEIALRIITKHHGHPSQNSDSTSNDFS